MRPASVVVITGHPATGKTSVSQYLANELGLPLFNKDTIKEALADVLVRPEADWSRQLSRATWRVLYRQTEALLSAGVDHVVEANFDPQHADRQWQRLAGMYSPNIIQVRCETRPDLLMARYVSRARSGERHPIHLDLSGAGWFRDMLFDGHLGWLDVPGPRLSVNTDDFDTLDLRTVTARVRSYL